MCFPIALRSGRSFGGGVAWVRDGLSRGYKAFMFFSFRVKHFGGWPWYINSSKIMIPSLSTSPFSLALKLKLFWRKLRVRVVVGSFPANA